MESRLDDQGKPEAGEDNAQQLLTHRAQAVAPKYYRIFATGLRQTGIIFNPIMKMA